MGGGEGAEFGVGVSLMLVGRVTALDQGCVCKGRSALPHLAEDEVAFYFLGGVEACSFGGLVVVEGYFDPVITSFIHSALS